MTDQTNRHGLQRPRAAGGEAKVSNVELFFDLVFVFAVTQLSHTLLKDVSWHNGLHTGLLFLAVWWVWIYTSWVTNWLDPERTPVRVALFVLMLAGIIVSAVADEMTLAHPLGHAEPRSAAMIVAGPLLYVAGNGLFKRAYTGRFPLSHGVGLAILVASALLGWHWPPLALYAATTLALLVAAAWETWSLKAA